MDCSNFKQKETQQSEDDLIKNTLLSDCHEKYQICDDDSLRPKENIFQNQPVDFTFTSDNNNVIFDDCNSHTMTSNLTKNKASYLENTNYEMKDKSISNPYEFYDIYNDEFTFPDVTVCKNTPSTHTNTSERSNYIPTEYEAQTMTSIVSQKEATTNLSIPSTSKYTEPFPTRTSDGTNFISETYQTEMTLPSTSKSKGPLPTNTSDGSNFISEKYRPEMWVPSTSKFKEPLPTCTFNSINLVSKKHQTEMSLPSTSKFKRPRPTSTVTSENMNFTPLDCRTEMSIKSTSKFKRPRSTSTMTSESTNIMPFYYQTEMSIPSTSKFKRSRSTSTMTSESINVMPFDYQTEMSIPSTNKFKRPRSTSTMTSESINNIPFEYQTEMSIPSTSKFTETLETYPFDSTSFFPKGYQSEMSIPNTSKLKRSRPTSTVTSETINLIPTEYQPEMLPYGAKKKETINTSMPITSKYKRPLPTSTVTSQSMNLIPNEYHPEISSYFTYKKEKTSQSMPSTSKCKISLPSSTAISESLNLIPNEYQWLPYVENKETSKQSMPSTSKSKKPLQTCTVTPESLNLIPNEYQWLPCDNENKGKTNLSKTSTTKPKRPLQTCTVTPESLNLIPSEYQPEMFPNVPKRKETKTLSITSTSRTKKPLPTSTVTSECVNFTPLECQPEASVANANESERSLLPTSSAISDSSNIIPFEYEPEMLSPNIPNNSDTTNFAMPSTSKFKRCQPIYNVTSDSNKRRARFFGTSLTKEDIVSKNFHRLYGTHNKRELKQLGLISGPDIQQPVHLKVRKANNTGLFCMRKTNDPSTAGFNSVRGDFNVEFDNNAEQLMSYANELYDHSRTEEREDDYNLMNELQIVLGDIYSSRLQDRKLRKEILKRFGLINQRGAKTWYSKYEMAVGKARLKKLIRAAHLMSTDVAERLFNFLAIMNEKRAEVNKLCFYRSQRGISTKLGKNIYEVAKCDRDAGFERVEIRNLIMPRTVKRKRTSMEIFHLPRYRDLKLREAELCSSNGLTPEFYLDTKDHLIADCKKNDGMLLKKARKLVKIDVNKTRKIYDFMLEQGFIWSPAQAVEPAKKKKIKKKKTPAAQTNLTSEPEDILKPD